MKIELESSYIYLGYKLLWILNQLISGKIGLDQDLNEGDWRNATYDVVKFAIQAEFLEEILQFDATQFFTVFSNLFKGNQTSKFLSEIKVYRPNQQTHKIF